MWRKNRKPQGSSCIGTDANRNFAFHHAGKIVEILCKKKIVFTSKNLFLWIVEAGASANPCSESYAGAKPFSEPESRALAEFIQSFDNIRLYLSFHSYGQMLLFPYVSTISFHFIRYIQFQAKKFWMTKIDFLQGHSKQRAVNFNSLVCIKIAFDIFSQTNSSSFFDFTESNWI